MLRFTIAKSLIEEAVGFEMNNLDTFPFSRLPNGLQFEVIEGLSTRDKIKLFKKNSGFQGYFARNGPFGRNVDLIRAFYSSWDVRLAAGCDRFLLPCLNRKRTKVLFQNIRSCKQLVMMPSNYWEEEDIDEETINYIADCFGNLCVVSKLRASSLSIPVCRQILSALRFEVTDWAVLNLTYKDRHDISEYADFLKSFLEKQLKNCKKVAMIGSGALKSEEVEKVLREIPGFELEEDSNKVHAILETCAHSVTTMSLPISDRSEVKCYRRKIGSGEQGFVLVALSFDYICEDYSNASYFWYFYDSIWENRSRNRSCSDACGLDADAYYDSSDYDDYTDCNVYSNRRKHPKK